METMYGEVLMTIEFVHKQQLSMYTLAPQKTFKK